MSDFTDPNTRVQQLRSRVDPAGVFTSINTTTSHAINILPEMSQIVFDMPRPFQPAVTQGHIELEVAHCVGGVISPLLANVYLHHVLDLWADWWRRHHARGEVIIVRFADLCRILIWGWDTTVCNG